jgi:NAD(P)H-dependent flavin oxidoreductase YrpB (nitropropane dioxygenase family)
MLKTSITKTFGLKTPIINAGMAFVAGPELAAAVANAGGLGMLGGAMVPPDGLRAMIRATRALTDRPFGVDFVIQSEELDVYDVIIEEKVPLVVFFWQLPSVAAIDKLRAAGVQMWMQVGSVNEAREAKRFGMEALIVQGSEAGGHNRAEAPLAQLFPRIRAALPEMPLIAAGGIVDGASMVGALSMGAEAVWCGTRFLASSEANAHDGYKQSVVDAKPGDTVLTTVFGPEFPGQSLRARRNEATKRSAGREAEALAESEGDIIGKVNLGGMEMPVPRYSAILPVRCFEADLEWSCLTMGESAARIDEILPAGEIVRMMTDQARNIVAWLGALAA